MGARLKFRISDIKKIASRYGYPGNEVEILDMRSGVIQRGYLTKSELEKTARWKAPRSAGHVQKNEEEYVQEITNFAFATHCERARIESLTLLDGVSWPTATTILHMFHSQPYPILDFRALWSASIEKPTKYNFDFWESFFVFCRSVARKANVDMRTLDKAMWQYSKENQ